MTQRYIVELRAMAGDWPPATVRLRRALRALRRCYGLAVTSAQELPVLERQDSDPVDGHHPMEAP